MRPLDNAGPHFIPLLPRLLNWLFPGRELRTLQTKAHGIPFVDGERGGDDTNTDHW